ncbi:MAG TPA: NrfD/PsrC family molybdoenzyme membrane anchor subunit [Gemmataceae bacterium]|jgi:hypothetical protein|nr:NrfD/PsrC family molybdoenzyme membrane anchor subunit [Gemmataceae bacterium]
MQPDSRAPSTVPGYGAGQVTKVPHWHGLVAWDLLFNSLSTGLFLVAAFSELAAPQVFASVAKLAYPVALVFLVADLVCLVLDLGDPLRFHHMLRVFKPSSPMSLGTWSLVVYSLPLTMAAALSLVPDGGMVVDWVRRAALVLGLLPALASAAYKGVLLSTNAQPGWKDARWLGGYLTSSALMLGSVEMLVLSVLMGQDRAVASMRTALGLLLVINTVPLVLLLVNLHPVLSRTHSRGHLWGAGSLMLGGGIVIPLVLLFMGNNPLPTLSAVALILLSHAAFRIQLIKIPTNFEPRP